MEESLKITEIVLKYSKFGLELTLLKGSRFIVLVLEKFLRSFCNKNGIVGIHASINVHEYHCIAIRMRCWLMDA